MNRYIFVLESPTPPQFFLGDKIGDAKIVEMKTEQLPNRVPVAWLMERFSLSRKTIVDRLRTYNKGDENKHLYDPKEVIPILENMNIKAPAKRGARRKN